MKYLKNIISFLTVAILLVAGIKFYRAFIKKAPPQLFKTMHPKKRTLSQNVIASGILQIKDLIKIGSVVSGTVKDLYVKENQSVKKGELLAEIDPGTGETDFESAFLRDRRAHEEFDYLQKNYERQKALFESGQLAQDAFEKIEKDFETSKINLKIAKVDLEKEQLRLSNRKILAVGTGFITAVNISKGASVSGADVSGSEAALFEIAPDVTDMEAKLDIDESDIGLIKAGQKVSLTINTYPDRMMFSKIRDIGFSPKKSGGTSFYKATIDVDNSKKILRPGMTLNAKIGISEVKDALCVPGTVFQINRKVLKKIAKKLGYDYQALGKNQRRSCKQTNAQERIKFLWTVQNNKFTEKAVVLGITDDRYFQIKSGIEAFESIITDIAESDIMEKVYKKWFKGPL